MDKTEILKRYDIQRVHFTVYADILLSVTILRLDAFRMSMNATAQKGVFGKLIVSDLSESKFINPSE